MVNFVKDSIRELQHVVWPTPTETKKYFMIVLVVLILFGLYLTLANFIFQEGIFILRDMLSK